MPMMMKNPRTLDSSNNFWLHHRDLRVSAVPTDARRGEGSSRIDRGLASKSVGSDVSVRPGDGEGPRTVRLRVDVRIVRAAACVRTATHRGRRPQARRASIRSALLRLLDTAIRARPEDCRAHVSPTADGLRMVLVGAVAGVAAGMASGRSKPPGAGHGRRTRTAAGILGRGNRAFCPRRQAWRRPAMLAVPWFTILAVALLAAVPAVIHAIRIDPVTMLRSE
jgi:hypothetical protein